MHFHIGEPHTLHAILQGIAGIGEACRVHDEAIDPALRRLIDAIDGVPFDVGIVDGSFIAVGVRMVVQHGIELRRRGGPVDRRLPFPKVGQIGPLYQEDSSHERLPIPFSAHHLRRPVPSRHEGQSARFSDLQDYTSKSVGTIRGYTNMHHLLWLALKRTVHTEQSHKCYRKESYEADTGPRNRTLQHQP